MVSSLAVIPSDFSHWFIPSRRTDPSCGPVRFQRHGPARKRPVVTENSTVSSQLPSGPHALAATHLKPYSHPRVSKFPWNCELCLKCQVFPFSYLGRLKMADRVREKPKLRKKSPLVFGTLEHPGQQMSWDVNENFPFPVDLNCQQGCEVDLFLLPR